MRPNGGVDAAARIHSSIAGPSQVTKHAPAARVQRLVIGRLSRPQGVTLFFAPEHDCLFKEAIHALAPVDELLALAVPRVKRRRELERRKIKSTGGCNEFTF